MMMNIFFYYHFLIERFFNMNLFLLIYETNYLGQSQATNFPQYTPSKWFSELQV